jgi:hypothetical protein
VPSSRHTGDQSKHARPVEARYTIRADVCSAGLADRLPVEQHGDHRIPRGPRLHDQVHLTGDEGNDDLAGALPKFDVLALAVPIIFQADRAGLPAIGADVRLVVIPTYEGSPVLVNAVVSGVIERQWSAWSCRDQLAPDLPLDFVVSPLAHPSLHQPSLALIEVLRWPGVVAQSPPDRKLIADRDRIRQPWSRTPRSMFSARLLNSNSGECTPITTRPREAYSRFHALTHGKVRIQLMQVRAAASSDHEYPCSSGLPAGRTQAHNGRSKYWM